MKILAFETSCDDTGVAIIEDGTRVLSNVKHSQVEHSEWGGVVPEIAARLHSERWRVVLEASLKQAGCTMDDIDVFAVTAGPGLQTSLLVGTIAASALSHFFQKKLIPVHHLSGHIASVALERNPSSILPFSKGEGKNSPSLKKRELEGDFRFPAISLVASGGHSNLYFCENFTNVRLLGQTRDDAAGEAFDKVSKLLDLGYPGGPHVSRCAEKGNKKAFDFPRPLLEKDSLDFSFSGVKAAVFRVVQTVNAETFPRLHEKFVADVCASFEMAVRDIFLKKLDRALSQFPQAQAIHFVGGVSANKFLRAEIEQFCADRGVQFFTTAKFDYSTDNAAMIGAAAFFQFQKNSKVAKIQFVDADPSLELRA